jgi:predicted kinase
VPPPLLVVVTGMPSSGKTTVAESLADRLRLPLFAKDPIKESLYDTFGASDVEASARLGAAAYALIFALAERCLASGASAIVEANFFRDQAREFSTLPDHRTIQLLCRAPLAVLMQRYTSRSRHPVHHDVEKARELPSRYESGVHGALDLAGDLIELDTTQPTDLDQLARRIRAAL